MQYLAVLVVIFLVRVYSYSLSTQDSASSRIATSFGVTRTSATTRNGESSVSILDLLRPKEVRASLLALAMEIENADTPMLSMGFELAAPAVRAAMRSHPDKVRGKIRDEHMSPKTVVYLMLVNQCGALVNSGRYHSCVNGLLMQGQALVALWQRAATELERTGVWSADESAEYRTVFRQQCA